MASDDKIEKTQKEKKRMAKQLACLTSVTFNTDLYGSTDKGAYVLSIPVNNDDDNAEAMDNEIARRMAVSYTAPKLVLNERSRGDDADEDLRIIDREDDYRQWRLNRIILLEWHDPCAFGEKTPDPSVRTYADVMREEALKREKDETLKLIAKKMKEREEGMALIFLFQSPIGTHFWRLTGLGCG
ncbi:hypothetical protein DVH24_033881 [Malus domestica]|uniref:Uncharacterized protein n=1 Tax=Malus domestica TaxID=3750 RepID=A0A498KS47_MALDO|nr:hypothetical protein DVH24_033881 [Malus domestica]